MENSVKMHRTQLFLPKDLHHELSLEAHSQGITLSELTRKVLGQYLHRQSRNESESGVQILLDMAELAGIGA